MIDIETFATTSDACIAQVACVGFTEHEVDLGGAFRTFVDLNAQPRRIDMDTMFWWMEQPDEVRQPLIAGCRVGVALGDALEGLARWFERNEPQRVWAHGLAFDISILESAFAQYGVAAPWPYRALRDTRTLYELKGKPDDERVDERVKALFGGNAFVKHDAYHDAVRQAVQVQEALR